MGYGLSAFLVSAHAATRVFGCRDSELLADLLESERRWVRNYDEQIVEDEEPRPLTHGQAIQEIIAGQYSQPELYHVYGWSFEIVCGYLGQRLGYAEFSPCRLEWFKELDAYLARGGVPLRFADLTDNCPVPLPPAEDWPCIGHWPAPQLRDAAPRLAELLPRVADRDVRAALTTVNRWLRRAALAPESMIVGFYG